MNDTGSNTKNSKIAEPREAVTDEAIASWLEYRELRARESAENPFLVAAGTNGAGLQNLAIIKEIRRRILALPKPSVDGGNVGRTTDVQIEWKPSDDDMELTALVGGKRVGGLSVFTDNKTGEVACWWVTIVQYGADREADVAPTLPAAKDAFIRLYGQLCLSVEKTSL
jgi:hypothetical protein